MYKWQAICAKCLHVAGEVQANNTIISRSCTMCENMKKQPAGSVFMQQEGNVIRIIVTALRHDDTVCLHNGNNVDLQNRT